MKLLSIIPILCAAYVIYSVWWRDKDRSTGNRVIWTVFALLFNVITAIVYAIRR